MYYKSKKKINFKDYIKQEKILKNNKIESFIGISELSNKKNLVTKNILSNKKCFIEKNQWI